MTRKITMSMYVLAPIVAVLVAAGCGGSSSSGVSSSPGGHAGYGYTPQTTGTHAGTGNGAAAAEVGVANSNLGHIVVNGTTRTLYVFEKDSNGRSACYGPCASYWPPLLSKGKPIALSGTNMGLIGTTRRTDGTEQVTYAGHPVYEYAGDTKPGQTTGEGLTDFGAAWVAISPTGETIAPGAS